MVISFINMVVFKMSKLKYNIDHIYSTSNKLEVTVSQTGVKLRIREQGQDNAAIRRGYRVVVSGETISYGDWNKSERDLLLETIKREKYAHEAYKELYYDLLKRLASIGLIQARDEDQLDDRL